MSKFILGVYDVTRRLYHGYIHDNHDNEIDLHFHLSNGTIKKVKLVGPFGGTEFFKDQKEREESFTLRDISWEAHWLNSVLSRIERAKRERFIKVIPGRLDIHRPIPKYMLPLKLVHPVKLNPATRAEIEEVKRMFVRVVKADTLASRGTEKELLASILKTIRKFPKYVQELFYLDTKHGRGAYQWRLVKS